MQPHLDWRKIRKSILKRIFTTWTPAKWCFSTNTWCMYFLIHSLQLTLPTWKWADSQKVTMVFQHSMFRCQLLVSGMVVQLFFLQMQHVRIQAVWFQDVFHQAPMSQMFLHNAPHVWTLQRQWWKYAILEKQTKLICSHKCVYSIYVYIYIQYMFFKHISYREISTNLSNTTCFLYISMFQSMCSPRRNVWSQSPRNIMRFTKSHGCRGSLNGVRCNGVDNVKKPALKMVY